MYLKPLTKFASKFISGGNRRHHNNEDILITTAVVLTVNILFLYVMRMIWNNQCVTYFNLTPLPDNYMGLLDLIALSLMAKFLLA